MNRKNINLKCEFIEELDFVKNVEVNEIKEACKRMKNHAASGCNKSFFSFLLPVLSNIFCKAVQIYIKKRSQIKQFEWLFLHKTNRKTFFC